MTAQTADNPLLAAWDAPFGAPPLDRIRPEHFAPAFERALAEHRSEIDAIAGEAAEPGFENAVAALERAPARPGVERVLRAGRRAHQRGDPGDRA
jgi:peptidyl-dipeptidase Dcp